MTEQQIALVTGANKGIGRATAEALTALGFAVVTAARRPGAGDVRLDVTDPGSIRAAAASVDERYGRLDVLVNNAGITGSGTVAPQDAWDQVPSTVDPDLVRSVFATNVFGLIAVTNAMLPLLRRSAAPRIVNLSSHAASMAVSGRADVRAMGLPASAAYTPSKAAVNALTVQYAIELPGFLVNAAAPGFCATDMNAHTAPGTPEQGAAVVVRLATLGPGGPTGGFFDADGPVPW